MRITERQLRRIIKEALLTEGMVTPDEAVEQEIQFVIKKRDDKVLIKALVRGMFLAGEIMSMPIEGIKCHNAWYVRWVDTTTPGLGPLLYDLMMDVVSPQPLTSDRETVSRSALNVWKYYLKNRPDIGTMQLDDPMDTLTPTDADNCYQDRSIELSKSRWPKSPLSKAYYRLDRATPTLDALQALGAITFD